MKQTVPDRSRLARYLMGELEEPEMEMVESYFEDQELFEELLEVEDELIEKFVCGKLSPSERKRFAGYLDRLPDGRERLKLAAALIEVADQEQEDASTNPSQADPAPLKPANVERVSLVESLLGLIKRQRPVFQFALAAVFVIAAGGALWLFIQNRQLSSINSQLREQLAEREQEQTALREKTGQLQQQAEATGTRLDQSEAELEQERQRRDEQAQEIASLRGLPSPVDEWALSPPEMRDALGAADTVVLRRGAKLVSIILPIKRGDQSGSYSAVLQTTEGDRVDERQRLPIISRKGGKAAVFRIDANKLDATGYKLTLIDPQGLAHDYYFNVTKR